MTDHFCFQVERRRRDTINSWIMKLGKLIPDLFSREEPPHRATAMSKGGILARACDYLSELRQENADLSRVAMRAEVLEAENERLRMDLEALRVENQALKRQLLDEEEEEEEELAGDAAFVKGEPAPS